MRPIKRARRPVRRYRSLLSPGIAVLAVLAFYAAFARPGPQRGETARFEQDGLCLEITGVHHIGGFLGNFDPERGVGVPFDTYYVYPGSAVTVLAAPGEGARWGLRWGEDGTLALADGMGPVELTEDLDGAAVYDRDTGLTVLSFEVSEEDEVYWR
ncbi:hypothetical protein [uncultured Oscillibacter sp.]|uniref:hypothetical protein n=1 Tax=uncultured Oscillibacter sp. TaxID=876091 RepID=UPI0025F1C9BA|nr:hypothetical protein [uncultured Oscillibacter sp.]